MKRIVLLFAALLVAGCGEKEQSVPAPEAEPVEPVAEAESPTKSEPKSKAMKANLLKGKWIEFGDTVRGGPETWEFHENGTVDIINEGKKMAGKYEVTPPDTVSMTVFGMAISAKISKSGDEITSSVGKYKKEGAYQAEAKPVEPVAEAAKPKPPTTEAPDISIHQAVFDGNIEAVKQHLAAGTDVNAKKEDGQTPLHSAVVAALDSGDNKVIELLIANGADVNAGIGSGRHQGMTPLDITGVLSEAATLTKRLREQQGKTDDIPVADLLRKHGGKTKKELEASGN